MANISRDEIARKIRDCLAYGSVVLLAFTMVMVGAQKVLCQTAGDVLKSVADLSPAERKAKLVEGAKKEGRFVFYGTLGIDASRPFLEAFRKAHPYLTIGHYRSGELGVYNKVANEAKAGRHEVDIIENSPGSAYTLIHEGLVNPYKSVEASNIRREFNDPKGLWHAYSYLVVGLGYNKMSVKDSEAPKSYDDILNPRWKGKMSLDTEDHDIFGTLLHVWGEEKGLAFFRKLAQQEILFRKGHTLQAQLLAAGESALAPWLYSHRPMMLIEKGAPLGLNFLDPVVSVPKTLLMARNAPHPHAAALFIDWALSGEGQHFVGMVIARSPVRKGQQQKFEKLGEPETVPTRPEVLGPNYDRFTDLYRKVFELQ
jgi:iron(III) transport system substrate-binding protein